MKNSGLLVLRRETKDIFTNNYNVRLMNIHRANIDLQFISDMYAVAEYVSNYCTKLESGQTALLRNINDEAIAEGEAAKETLSKLSKALDRGREVGIQEAIYRLLGLTMTKFSEVVKFINSAHPHRRDGLLRQDAEDLPDGESVFHNSVHDYYSNRPNNNSTDGIDWDRMTLAKFVANYNIVQKISPTQRNESLRTYELKNKKGFALKRTRECVIRYFLRYENNQEYHRALCVLFLPFRDEMSQIHTGDVTQLYLENQNQIEIERSHFEKHKKLADLVAEIEKDQDKPLGDIDEDYEDQHDGFEVEETTDPADLEKFAKEAQAAAKSSLRNCHPVEKMPNDEYLEKINSLNTEQRRIFDDIVERLMDVAEPEPFYLYIGGEAGTGKSYLLRLLKEAANRIPRFSGQELDKPLSLTMAPTGVAAYLIQGMTIESALGMRPGSKWKFSVGSQARNSSLRFTYEDLKVIFLDEVSMCGTESLSKINLKLQEIRGNNLFMGGVSVICFGDFGQLPPVGQKMIWESSHVDGRPDLAPNLWDDNFKIYYLTEKMRSSDGDYSNICDKVRRGEKTPDVISYFNIRVKPCQNEDNLKMHQQGKICIIVTSNKHRTKINLDKLQKLIPDQLPVSIVSSDKSTNVLNPPPLLKTLPLTQTGQLEHQIIFKKGAPVMVTSNSQEPKYKQNGLVNGVRGYIDSFQYSKEDPSSPEVIWVRFNDDKTGQLLRTDNLHLLQHHKPDDPLSVPIFRQKKTFNQKGDTEWLRHQFPLTLCFAVTAHKVNCLFYGVFN